MPSSLFICNYNTFGFIKQLTANLSPPSIESNIMASAGKASLVVATSMSAVEALKDQLGLCRWNYIIRNLNRQATNPIARPSSHFRQASAAAAVAVEQNGAEVYAAEEKTRRRRAEKAEKVMNLVCWGPN